MRLEQSFTSLRPAVQQIKIFENRYSINIIGYDPNSGKYLGLEIARSGNHTSSGAVKDVLSSSKAGVLKYGGKKGDSSSKERAGSSGSEEGGLDIKFLPTAFDSEVQVKEYIANRGLMLLHENVYCIYGIIRLTENYYVIAVTQAEVVATMHGNHIYKITETAQIPVTYRVRNTQEESRYKSILQLTDFSSGFYFSYTYDLTNSLQRITERDLRNKAAHPPLQERFAEVQEMFAWNFFALEPVLALGAGAQPEHDDKDCLHWVVPVVYGYVRQSCIELCDDHRVRYSLIARRSRHFAGTRYLRRGVDSEGFVANEVETEQILTREMGALGLQRSSSLVQLRGSIPLYWSHTNLLSPQPGIVIEDENSRNSAWRHFSRLRTRYGSQINVLNLVRQSESAREVLVGRAYTELCHEYMLLHDERLRLCSQPGAFAAPLRYVSYDFLANRHSAGGEGLFGDLAKIGESFYPHSGYFVQPALGAAQVYARFPIDSDSAVADALTGERLDLSEEQEQVLRAVTLLKGDYYDAADVDLNLVDDDSEEGEGDGGVFVRAASQDSSDGSPAERQSSAAADAAGEGEGEGDASLAADLLSHITFETFFDTMRLVEDSEAFDSGAVEPHDLELDAADSSFQQSKRRIDVLMARHASESYELGGGAPVGVLQTGVLRTNCIDCLDRTNIGQFCYARTVLLKQLKALGMSLSRESLSGLLALCMESWAAHGDELAKQYAGSGAMHRLDEKVGDNNQREYVLAAGASNALVAIQRYFSNVSFDAERQQAMDLLLGVHRPQFGRASVWEEDSRPSAVRRRSAELACAYRERSATLATSLCAGLAGVEVAVAVAAASDGCDGGFLEGDTVSLDIDDDVYRLSLPLLGGGGAGTRGVLSSFHDDDFLRTDSLTDLAQAARGRLNTVALNRARYLPYPKRQLFAAAAASNSSGVGDEESAANPACAHRHLEEGLYEQLQPPDTDGGEAQLGHYRYLHVGLLLDCASTDKPPHDGDAGMSAATRLLLVERGLRAVSQRLYEQTLSNASCESSFRPLPPAQSDLSRTSSIGGAAGAIQEDKEEDSDSDSDSDYVQEVDDDALRLDAANQAWLEGCVAPQGFTYSCFPSFGHRAGPRRAASSADDECAPEEGSEVSTGLLLSLDPGRMILDSTNQFVGDSISTLKWLTFAPFASTSFTDR